MSKPGLPQGTRDFSPETVIKRNHILSTIKSVFELYGFQPLETPAMENLETLMGKYGDEGDKLIFRILNNGLGDPKNIEKARAGFENTLAGKYDKNLTERALRYDLTIPFARYVAMNFGQLTFPFRRYQVQPVWRADRPQKGRYREFFQCDADVVGSNSLVNEVELTLIYHEVFKRLNLQGCEIRLNSRKILAALAEKCGGLANLTDITVAIDKLDKIGIERVREELAGRSLETSHISTIEEYLNITGSNEEKLEITAELLQGAPGADAGIAELRFVLDRVHRAEASVPAKIDLTLARGLNYYTGLIFEVKAPAHVNIGSIGGGGRYDDLTGLFGVAGVPGVGISFGVDRIYDVLEELNLFPSELSVSTDILFLNQGGEDAEKAFLLVQKLRSSGVRSELYHENAKLDKQYKYAEKKSIPLVASLADGGENVKVKDIRTGETRMMGSNDVAGNISQLRPDSCRL